jgi:hypothetical protein
LPGVFRSGPSFRSVGTGITARTAEPSKPSAGSGRSLW